MKPFLFVFVCFSVSYLFSQSKDIKTAYVRIDNQLWMAGNLMDSTYRNGDPILFAKNTREWEMYNKSKQGAYCYYRDNKANNGIYGFIYNKFVLNDPRGIGPMGYHIPNEDESKKLMLFSARKKHEFEQIISKSYSFNQNDAPHRKLHKSKFEKENESNSTIIWYVSNDGKDSSGGVSFSPKNIWRHGMSCINCNGYSQGYYIRPIMDDNIAQVIIQKQDEESALFATLIEEANTAIQKEKLNIAIEKLTMALDIRPNDKYAKEKLFWAKEEKKKKDAEAEIIRYDNLLKSANQALLENKLVQAEELYSAALKQKPNDKIPQEQLEKIYSLRQVEEKKENEKELQKLDSLCLEASISKQTGAKLSYQNKEYKTVQIGNLTWMTENLDVKTFKNGDEIPQAKTNEEWINSSIEKKPAWCFYQNDSNNGEEYGVLYNWYAVNDPRGLAPSGWHVANSNDFRELNKINTQVFNMGYLLKSTSGWYSEGIFKGNGCNALGFNGIPGGGRNIETGEFYDTKGKSVYYWTSDEFDVNVGEGTAEIYKLSYNNDTLIWADFFKGFGAYVRCVKN